MGLQTVVIVDGLENLDAATDAANRARPHDELIFSVYGITECAEVPDSEGGIRHVHSFGDNISVMRDGAERRRAKGSFGGYLYATATPTAPHVQKHSDGLLIVVGQRPQILQLG